MTGKGPKAAEAAAERAQRSAEALRANLRRRKAQERQRAEPQTPAEPRSIDPAAVRRPEFEDPSAK